MHSHREEEEEVVEEEEEVAEVEGCDGGGGGKWLAAARRRSTSAAGSGSSVRKEEAPAPTPLGCWTISKAAATEDDGVVCAAAICNVSYGFQSYPRMLL